MEWPWMSLACLARVQALTLRARLASLARPRRRRYQYPYLYPVRRRGGPMQTSPTPNELKDQGVMQPPEAPAPTPPRMIYLLRHGQTTFNVEGRLPGQLDGVALTDEGRRQAYRAAVALSGVPLTAVIASPLERALETARMLARGGALEVRVDPRLKDTDVGSWAGQKIGELEKRDPAWKAFLEHPEEPPPGVESLAQVQQRAVAVIEELRRDASVGACVAVVSHADVVKLILAYYMQMRIQAVRYVSIGTASISALAFQGEQPPHVLGVNWTPLPEWLAPPPSRVAARDAAGQPQTSATAGQERLYDPAPPHIVS
jgi:broad specificity phosphatase PhoE